MPGFRGYVLTLTGAPVIQNVRDALVSTLDPTNKADLDMPLRAVTFQSLKANSNDIYVGGENMALTLSSTVHAFRIDPGDTAPPIIIGSYDSGGSKFSDFYVTGTAGEKLLIGGVVF